jgi:3-dehydroquinate synthase
LVHLLEVKSRSGKYEVVVGENSRSLIDSYEFGIIDQQLVSRNIVRGAGLWRLESSEILKTLGSVEMLLSDADSRGMNKQHTPVAVGGGLIQDVATLGYSIYMRGVNWDFFPTTLMAMVDSCIGGKSSINLGKQKNRLGNFHPPKKIFVDPSFLATLDPTSIASGLSEASKIMFASGPDAFSEYLNNRAAYGPGSDSETASLIHLVLKTKAGFIEEDEFDTGRRRLLNFGHSFAHALEASSNFGVQHGIAVALGMLSAIQHSSTRGLPIVQDLQNYLTQLLRPFSAEISTLSGEVDWVKFRLSLKNDKKNSIDQINLVLPDSRGSLRMQGFPSDITELSRATDSIQWALAEVGNN